jgi:hypothetical protein
MAIGDIYSNKKLKWQSKEFLKKMILKKKLKKI